MNREQAKIIGQMSDEQLRVIEDMTKHDDFPIRLVCHREQIIAFGNGQDIERRKDTDELGMIVDNDPNWRERSYRIATPKITFNGVEIDAPIKHKDVVGDELVWFVDVDPIDGRFRASEAVWNELYIVNYKSGRVFATEEACQLYCDTHNKMMGIEG